ncbi:Ribosomal protein L5 [Metarhizium album ARSEF 1941]|uniref:Ribosomal protein L5 n=1 Tax=Metarhizium album (strain ARSEF 1941) TaxID=1081103 RepID=A0A0B2WQP9_METAS|nr:Ribosomal protein L5 [Metarhizium album ARSEF 1941]KHN95812.1 Ribosomal protein L5 [Metarhizium album ARSEF 1941]
MSGVHKGSRLLKTLGQGRFRPAPAPLCARSFSSPPEAKPTQNDDLSDLESTTTFTPAAPDQESIDAFNQTESLGAKGRRLPGSRYQYHPPKYYRGPLHPVQTPPASDPTARDFVPGPFSFPRLKHTYDSTIAPDLLTMTYQHTPPGTAPVVSQKGTLRQWDGSSPYHKNRPARGPRGGGSSRLGILERNINWNNIPEIEAVTINSYAPNAAQNKEYLHVARAVVQAISGAYPQVTTVKHHVIHWGVRKGDKAGSKVTLRGGAAYEFVDKLVTLVLPKIKDWPGIKASTGDDSGNLAFGMKPEWMAYFPEIEFNYDAYSMLIISAQMYPPKLVPGCDIFIHTTGTSDRQGRLLMEALGFPFYGKATR